MDSHQYQCPHCGVLRHGEGSIRSHLYLQHDIRITSPEELETYRTLEPRNGTMDTSLVPVTEAEMTSFFQRVTTSFVSLSKQAAELEEVKVRLSDVTNRVNELADTNTRLTKERDDALIAELRAQEERNYATKNFQELSRRHGDVLDTIIRRDSRITELEGLLTSQTLEAQDWQRRCERQEIANADLTTTLASVREGRNHWRERADTAERALAEANDKLAKHKAENDELTKKIADIFGLVEQPKPVEVVEEVKQVSEVPAPEPIPTDTLGQSGSSSANTSGQSTAESGQSPETERPWWATQKNPDDLPF